MAGELSVHPDGFGFVTPESGGGQDIYLYRGELKGGLARRSGGSAD